MTPDFILRASLCRKPHCGHDDPVAAREQGESTIENMGYAREYAEPGYQNPAKGILFSNWNHFPSKAVDLLEQYGYSCEWEDEWSTCDDCGKAIRTSADSYGWQSYYIMGDGHLTCLDCVDWADYLQSIEDNPRKAVVRKCNPEDYGYVRLSEPSEYESGWHPGQNDDPVKILKRLHEQGKRHIIFRVPSVGQFDISFETWQRVEQEED